MATKKAGGRVATVERWTGREAKALRKAKRMSLEAFAAHLGVSERTLSTWELRGETITIREVNQAALDTSLKASSPDVHERFVSLTGGYESILPAGIQKAPMTFHNNSKKGTRATVSKWPSSMPGFS